MIDMWDLLTVVVTLYGLLTWPIYAILQKPWVKEADRSRRRAVIEPAGHGRLRYSHDFHGTLDEAVTYVQSRPNGTLVDLLDWVCSKHEKRDCIGARKILKQVDGSFDGKPVKKVSKSQSYETLTYSQFKSKTERIASGISAHYGLAKGDKVLIFANTRSEWIIIAVAVIKAGGVVTTLVPSMTTQSLAFALKQMRPVKVVITEASLDKKLQDVFEASGERPPVVYMDTDDRKDLSEGSVFLECLEGEGEKIPYVPASLKSSDRAVIMYTSGTTSAAKGVCLTHRQLVESICGYTYFAQLFSPLAGQELRFLQFLPLSHIFALSVSLHVIVDGNCLLFGSPYTLTDASLMTVPGEKGDLTAGRPHYMIAIPLILQRLKDGIEKKIAEKGPNFYRLFKFCTTYKAKWVDMGYQTPILDALIFARFKRILGGSLTHVIVGGAPMGEELQTFCRNVLCTVVVQGYGCTESGGLATCQDKESQETGSVGYPPINGSILLESWEEGGYSVKDPRGPAGEVLLCGPNVADGYFQCLEENAAFQNDEAGNRVFRTGDIGRINPATNSLSIIDRKSQLIKLQNGEYISLGRIECALQSSRYVEQACVFAKPQKRGCVAVIVAEKTICHALPQWKRTTNDQNGGSMSSQQPLGADEDQNNKLLLDLLKTELKDTLVRYEVPLALASVEGPWTPESGLVTGALKTKRKSIQERYKTVVDNLFASI